MERVENVALVVICTLALVALSFVAHRHKTEVACAQLGEGVHFSHLWSWSGTCTSLDQIDNGATSWSKSTGGTPLSDALSS